MRERTARGEAIYELDEDALRALEPELIVTQALCPVCAVSYNEVAELARRLPSRPRVIALDPHTLGETLGDVRTLAQATGRRAEGVELVARAAGRIDRVRLAVRGRPRPRVARAGVAGSGVRRGPLDAAADRARRRRGRPWACPASRRGRHPGRSSPRPSRRSWS